jgi:hypothetical protein
MRVSGLGVDPVTLTTAASVGSSFFSKLFGGGDVNYGNRFSAMVGVGKTFLQTDADAYYARSERIGVSAFDIARWEHEAQRVLTNNEVLALAGKAPAAAIGQPPAYSEAFTLPFTQSYRAAGVAPAPGVSWPLIIGGGVAVLGIGAALFMTRK